MYIIKEELKHGCKYKILLIRDNFLTNVFLQLKLLSATG